MNRIVGSSTYVYEFFYDVSKTNEILNDILSQDINWTNLRKVGHKFNYGYLNNETQSSYYHKELFEWFDKCLAKVANAHFPHLNLAICDSWLTKSEKNDMANRHTHHQSIFTGVFYLNNNPNSKLNLYFDDPINQKLNFLIGRIKENIVPITPEAGKLIIFPSDTPHTVDMHLSDTPRYSLVFGTFFNSNLHIKANGESHYAQRLTLDVKFNK